MCPPGASLIPTQAIVMAAPACRRPSLVRATTLSDIDLGQVMNKVQMRRASQPNIQVQTKNKVKQKEQKELGKNSVKHPRLPFFKAIKFMLKTFHHLLAIIVLTIPVWIFCSISKLIFKGDWGEVHSEYSVAILGSRSPLAVHLARHFRKMGYTVIGFESKRYMAAPLAWSRACDKFFWLPDPVEPPAGVGPDIYVEALWNLIFEIRPNLLILLNKYSYSEDQQAIEKVIDCIDLLSIEPMEILKLTDVNTFYTAAAHSNCKTPQFELITDKGKIPIKGFNFEDNDWVYRITSANTWASKLIETPKTARDVSKLCQYITTATPVLKVEKMEGPVISLCSLYANRKAIAHAISKREGNLITNVSDRKIATRVKEWCDIFVERYNVDIEGWLSFDFMKSTEDGNWYPINCKPWITEPFALLHDFSQELVESIELTTRGREDLEPILNCEDAAIRCCGEELITAFRKIYKPSYLFKFFSNIDHKDILFIKSDPFPFFATYFVDLPMQLWLYWRTGKLWDRIDYFNNVVVSGAEVL